MRAILIGMQLALLVPLTACGENCGPVGASCGAPPTYDLVLAEGDSGKSGISTIGGAVAFLLDAGRDRFSVSPTVAFRKVDDSFGQFPGRTAFAMNAVPAGIYDITAAGGKMPPFTFHLIVATRIGPGLNLAHPGTLLMQEFATGPPAADGPLSEPTFDLVQEAVAVGNTGRLLSTRPAPMRRAYRAARIGIQTIEGAQVVVADPPKSFVDFVDGGAPSTHYLSVGDSFLLVLVGKRQLLTWSVEPADGVVGLQGADVGPLPAGVSLIPLRLMVYGPVTLLLPSDVGDLRVLINPDPSSCLPDDFPRYPLAKIIGTTFNSQPCVVDLQSQDSSGQIVAFFRSRLNQADWRIVSANGTTVSFSRRSSPGVKGTVNAGTGGDISIRISG